MSRFLFAVIPAYGHFNPTVPVARELLRRGHGVAYVSGHAIEKVARQFEFYPVGPRDAKDHPLGQALRRFQEEDGWHELRSFFQLMIRAIPASLPELRSVIRRVRPDALFVDSMAYGAAFLAEQQGIPWATSSEFPGMIPHSDYPPFTGMGLAYRQQGLQGWAWRFCGLLARQFARSFDPALNALRKELGLSRRRLALIESTLSPYLDIAYTVQRLEYGRLECGREEWPAQVHLVGPSLWDEMDGISEPPWLPRLRAERQRSRPVLYVSLPLGERLLSVRIPRQGAYRSGITHQGRVAEGWGGFLLEYGLS